MKRDTVDKALADNTEEGLRSLEKHDQLRRGMAQG